MVIDDRGSRSLIMIAKLTPLVFVKPSREERVIYQEGHELSLLDSDAFHLELGQLKQGLWEEV